MTAETKTKKTKTKAPTPGRRIGEAALLDLWRSVPGASPLIEAIKAYRQKHPGMSLRDAKEAVMANWPGVGD